MSKKQISKGGPQEMKPTPVVNMSKREQKVSRTVEVETSETSSFEFGRAFSVGISMTVSGDIPIIGGGGLSVTTSFEASQSYTTGKSRCFLRTQ